MLSGGSFLVFSFSIKAGQRPPAHIWHHTLAILAKAMSTSFECFNCSFIAAQRDWHWQIFNPKTSSEVVSAWPYSLMQISCDSFLEKFYCSSIYNWLPLTNLRRFLAALGLVSLFINLLPHENIPDCYIGADRIWFDDMCFIQALITFRHHCNQFNPTGVRGHECQRNQTSYAICK